MLAGRRIALLGLAGGLGAAIALAMAGLGRAEPPAPAQAAQNELAASPLARYLRFTGTGTVHVRPDTAGISFTTTGTGSSKAEAVAQAGGQMRHVIDAMEHHGVRRGDLQTSSDVYDDTSRGVWVASEYLQVTVHDTRAASQLISRGLAAGADSSSGPQYSLSDTSTGYDAALQAAVADARAHAEAAASLIGVRVSGVISVDDASPASTVPIYGTAADSLSAVPVMPQREGKQDVTVSVVVTFGYTPA